MDEIKPQAPAAQTVPLAAGISLDFASKSVAAIAIIVYGCGFIVTSIYQSSYGLFEANPFRPRVASAGIWFLLFLAGPIALVFWLRRSDPETSPHGIWRQRLSTRVFFYAILSVSFGNTLQGVFDTRVEDSAKGPEWLVMAPLLIMLPCLVLITLDQIEQFPKALAPITTITFIGFLLVFGYRETFVYHRFFEGAITYWFLATDLAPAKRIP